MKWVGRIEVWSIPLQSLMSTQYGVLIGDPKVYPPTPISPVGVLMTEAKVGSSFELPWPAKLQRGSHRVRGRSWSPAGTISKVEVSVDGGAYRAAKLIPPNLEKAWCPWEIDVKLAPGKVRSLRARATDSVGNVQPDAIPYNFHGYLDNAVLEHPVIVS